MELREFLKSEIKHKEKQIRDLNTIFRAERARHEGKTELLNEQIHAIEQRLKYMDAEEMRKAKPSK